MEMTSEEREQWNKGLEITKNCFDDKLVKFIYICIVERIPCCRATDGKIAMDDLLPVYCAVMEQYKEVGLMSADEVDDYKSFPDDLQVIIHAFS